MSCNPQYRCPEVLSAQANAEDARRLAQFAMNDVRQDIPLEVQPQIFEGRQSRQALAEVCADGYDEVVRSYEWLSRRNGCRGPILGICGVKK
jgi:hypothetical protein